MWHFRTLSGIFWIVQSDECQKFLLGVDEESLGQYESYQSALDSINAHATGHLAWDARTHMRVPASIEKWAVGEPAAWA